MVRIAALYPNTPGSRFDADYYLGRHSAFARSLLEPRGLQSLRTLIGGDALDGGPAPYWAISEMVFGSRAAFDAAIAECGEALFADLPNYTDVSPVLQLAVLHDA